MQNMMFHIEGESGILIDPLDLLFISILVLGLAFLVVKVRKEMRWRQLLGPFSLIAVGSTGILLTFIILPALQTPQDHPETVHVQLWPGFYKPFSEQAIGYVPQDITIVLGVNSTVAWDNGDSKIHTAHSDTEEFNTGEIPPYASKSHTFVSTGVFTYHCDFHPWRTGQVTVVEGG